MADYPISVAMPQERAINRWWGLLWFGIVVRAILLIPGLIILMVIGFLVVLSQIILWIPILLLGKVPDWYQKLVGASLNRNARINAYGLLVPGGYPDLNVGGQGPVQVQVNAEGRSINRLWGIPLIGFCARIIALIPHFIVLGVLYIGMYVYVLLVWIPILINGRYPELAAKFMGVVLNYGTRISGYMLFLPVPYPPFDFS